MTSTPLSLFFLIDARMIQRLFSFPSLLRLSPSFLFSPRFARSSREREKRRRHLFFFWAELRLFLFLCGSPSADQDRLLFFLLSAFLRDFPFRHEGQRPSSFSPVFGFCRESFSPLHTVYTSEGRGASAHRFFLPQRGPNMLSISFFFSRRTARIHYGEPDILSDPARSLSNAGFSFLLLLLDSAIMAMRT